MLSKNTNLLPVIFKIVDYRRSGPKQVWSFNLELSIWLQFWIFNQSDHTYDEGRIRQNVFKILKNKLLNWNYIWQHTWLKNAERFWGKTKIFWSYMTILLLEISNYNIVNFFSIQCRKKSSDESHIKYFILHGVFLHTFYQWKKTANQLFTVQKIVIKTVLFWIFQQVCNMSIFIGVISLAISIHQQSNSFTQKLIQQFQESLFLNISLKFSWNMFFPDKMVY